VQKYIEQGGLPTGVGSASSQNRVWVTGFIAVLCIITLTNWDLQASALSGIPVGGLLVVYVALTLSSGKRASYSRLHIIRPLAFRVVVTLLVVLGVEIIAFGAPRADIVDTILLGVAKSMMWHFVLQTVCSPASYPINPVLTSVRLRIVPGQ
jgi:hypothetical protein